MIASIAAYLDWFAGVNRRAMRDVGALPRGAQGWRPAAGEGESAWTIDELVRHMAMTRAALVRGYLGEGWKAQPWPRPTSTVEEWVAALDESGAEVRRRLEGTPDAWLTREVPGQDPGRTAVGWKILINLAEHDIHHRSQIDTYAGLNGWDVQQLYGRRAEDVGLSPRAESG